MKHMLLVFALAAVFSGRGAPLVDYDFSKNLRGWQAPPYWSGKIARDNSAMRITPQRSKGKDWARAYSLYKGPGKLAGRILEFSATLSGGGTARLGAIVYTRTPDGKVKMPFVWSPDFALTDTPSVCKYRIDLSEESPFQIGLCIEITGKKDVLCRRIALVDATPTDRPGPLSLSAPADKKMAADSAVYIRTFDRGAEGWAAPSYWGGTLKWDKEGFLRLSSTSAKGRSGGGMYGLWEPREALAGAVFDFSARVRGKGTFKLGVIPYGRDARGKNTYPPTVWSREVELTDTWRRIGFTVDLSHLAPFKLGLRVSLTSEGEVCVDDVRLRPMRDPGLRITAEPEYAARRAGDDTPELAFHLSDSSASPVLFVPAAPASPVPMPVRPDAAGKVRLTPEQTAKNGVFRLAARGVSSELVIENMPAEQYDLFDAAAKKTVSKKPVNILVIGDSLLDGNFFLNRRTGVIKQLNFWLNKHAPGKFSIRNAAVRGDSIERVWQRICFELGTGKQPAFEQSVYAGLFEFPADIILIQLGHNDTRTSSQQKFARPAVPPSRQKELYRLMLKQFRKTWPASAILLVSSTSSNYALTGSRAEEAVRKFPGRNAVLFGVPRFMEDFNAVLRDLAPQFSARYGDIYTAMKALPQEQKAQLLSSTDGVHLSAAGRTYLALRYLELLAELGSPLSPPEGK